MNTTPHPYPQTLCDKEMVEFFTCEGNNNGYKTPLPEHCGYTLINDCLIPETFIQLVRSEARKIDLQYGYVLRRESIFEQEFLDSLDELELAVLMPVVLQLVARDELFFNLWSAFSQEEDSE